MMRRKASPKARIATSVQAVSKDRDDALGPRSGAPEVGTTREVRLLHGR